jgi:hypothetical protein
VLVVIGCHSDIPKRASCRLLAGIREIAGFTLLRLGIRFMRQAAIRGSTVLRRALHP